MIISRSASDEKKLLSPNQFYRNSDFNLEDEFNSDDKLKYYQELADTKHETLVKHIGKLRERRRTKTFFTIELLTERVKYLESLIDIEPFDLEKELNDKV